MKRRYRVAFSLLIAGLSIAAVIGMLLLGSESEGPLARALQGVGTRVSKVESNAVRRVRGPGRAHEMQWAARYQTNPGALRAPDTLLLGVYHDELPHSLDGALALEDTLGVQLPLIQVYTAWGDRPDQGFPARIANAIAEIGSIPVITWEPWLVDFENRLHPELPLRDDRARGGLAAIAQGKYDFYIDMWARDAARFGRPVMLRFAHEMNDPYRYPWGPQNNSAGDFVAAWRHVVARFRAAGATNAVWVWAPHVAYAGYDSFYPGAEWVDWVATGALNYGTVAHWSRWWSFKEIFGDRYTGLARYGKPVMIAEFSSLAVGGSRSDWYAEALRDVRSRYPAVKALLFFEVANDKTVTYQALDWSIAHDTAALRAVRAALRPAPTGH